MTSRRAHRGVQAVDVAVVVAVLGLLALVIFAAMPRQREVSRKMTCERNLAKIGVALAIYDQDRAHLPPVPELGAASSENEVSPFAEMLAALKQPDFTTMDDSKTRPPQRDRPDRGEWRINGLVCPSDPSATASPFAAPVSYRATTGSTASGKGGPFAPGVVRSIADIEAADGAAYTAAFSERLVGDRRNATSSTRNYALVPGPVDGGCGPIGAAAWRADAGSSWLKAGWTSTLYNHTLTPGAAPSCVAADGRSARMGASSGHVPGVHVLLFDLSVKTYTPKIDPRLWRELADINDAAARRPSRPRSASETEPDRSR